jgi:hypothetical protein
MPSSAAFESSPPIFARVELSSARFRYSPTTRAVTLFLAPKTNKKGR